MRYWLPTLLMCLLPLAGCSPGPKTQSNEDVSKGKQKEALAKEKENLTDDTHMSPDKMTQTDTKLHQQAMADFDKAIEADPKNPKAYYARGFAYLTSSKDMKKAILDFNKAIELDPQYAQAYLMRGRAHEALGDKDQAKADREKALELEPGID